LEIWNGPSWWGQGMRWWGPLLAVAVTGFMKKVQCREKREKDKVTEAHHQF